MQLLNSKCIKTRLRPALCYEPQTSWPVLELWIIFSRPKGAWSLDPHLQTYGCGSDDVLLFDSRRHGVYDVQMFHSLHGLKIKMSSKR